MSWIEVTLWAQRPTTEKLLLNIEAISQVGGMFDHGYIKRIDGGSVEVVETYKQLVEALIQVKPL